MDIMFRHGLLIGTLLFVQPALAQTAVQPALAQGIAPLNSAQPADQSTPTSPPEEVPWFTIFNVSSKELPGSYYAYSIVPATGSPQSCISPCQQLTLPEQRDGVSPIPASCFVPNCSLYLNVYLQGKTAGPSCQNIDLTNISEVWVYFNNDRFSAICQAFYPTPPAIPGGLLPVGGILPTAAMQPLPAVVPPPSATPTNLGGQ